MLKKDSLKAEVIWEIPTGGSKEKVKMAAAGKILEMGEDPEDEGGGWR